ncbi:hypothetical protein PRABACTJOHN_01686 [Parabacteroides johnsonii DSM 18315]|uniref:Uncharacterized protein n=1 Tax=Parabacteroides johnsonii DSM 18315 TaxID=537006 RepID=B7B9I3_9BACT|nr:hypothetical protein PRABACTJOHN_01686 [Parabacteroides johnsonii DSM 18315]
MQNRIFQSQIPNISLKKWSGMEVKPIHQSRNLDIIIAIGNWKLQIHALIKFSKPVKK